MSTEELGRGETHEELFVILHDEFFVISMMMQKRLVNGRLIRQIGITRFCRESSSSSVFATEATANVSGEWT